MSAKKALSQVMIKYDSEEPVFLDLDSITPLVYDPADEEIVRRRRAVYTLTSQDRHNRLGVQEYLLTSQLCLPRDDIYSICAMMMTYCVRLLPISYGLGEKKISRKLKRLVECFREYRDTAKTDGAYEYKESRPEKGRVIDQLIRDIERIAGRRASSIPAISKPQVDMAASSILRPLARGESRGNREFTFDIFSENNPFISTNSSDDIKSFTDKLELPTFLVLLNPTVGAISWIDGSVFEVNAINLKYYRKLKKRLLRPALLENDCIIISHQKGGARNDGSVLLYDKLLRWRREERKGTTKVRCI